MRLPAVGDVRGMAQAFDELSRLICPVLAKMLFALLLGMVFGLGNYAFLLIASAGHSAPVVAAQMALLLWTVFNLVFNYCMACFVPAGSPQDIPLALLADTRLSCRKCGGAKPARTHHCSICDRCVLQMDHHCPWIGGCMGHHNRGYFNNFLTYTTLALAHLCCLAQFRREPLVFTFAATMLAVLLPFSAYHWCISLRGVTSLEVCREDPRYSPSASWRDNLRVIYGSSSLAVCLLPRVSVNPLWGCRWPEPA